MSRVINGVGFNAWNDITEKNIPPKIGQTVAIIYKPNVNGGSVCATLIDHDNSWFSSSNIGEGIIRKMFSPNKNTYWVLEVEVTREFGAEK